jgi:hypothetical protein
MDRLLGAPTMAEPGSLGRWVPGFVLDYESAEPTAPPKSHATQSGRKPVFTGIPDCSHVGDHAPLTLAVCPQKSD